MELNEFLEKFNANFPENWEKHDGYLPSEQYFMNALQNFSDMICEKQRNICENYNHSFTFYVDVSNAKQPKIDEL